MDNSSGVGVLDKAAIVLGALEAGPGHPGRARQATGLARPTAHRLATALEHHRLVARDLQGRFVLGPRLRELASAAGEDRLLEAAGPVLAPAARHHRRERAALPPRRATPGLRRCGRAAIGLRDTVPVGATLSMKAGSAAQILLAWEEPERLHRGLQRPASPRPRSPACGAAAGRRASASGSRESPRCRPRCAAPGGRVVAAVSVSGPIERLSRSPGRLQRRAAVIAAAARLTESMRRSGGA